MVALGKVDGESKAAVRTRYYCWYCIWSYGLEMVTEAWQKVAESSQVMTAFWIVGGIDERQGTGT